MRVKAKGSAPASLATSTRSLDHDAAEVVRGVTIAHVTRTVSAEARLAVELAGALHRSTSPSTRSSTNNASHVVVLAPVSRL